MTIQDSLNFRYGKFVNLIYMSSYKDCMLEFNLKSNIIVIYKCDENSTVYEVIRAVDFKDIV